MNSFIITICFGKAEWLPHLKVISNGMAFLFVLKFKIKCCYLKNNVIFVLR